MAAVVASGLQGTEMDEAFRPPVIPAGAQEGHGEHGRFIPLRDRAPPFPEPTTQPILPEHLRELDNIRTRLTALSTQQKEKQRLIKEAETELETRRTQIVEMLERSSAVTHLFSTENILFVLPAQAPDGAERKEEELPPLFDLEDRFRTGVNVYLERYSRQKQELLTRLNAELATIQQELDLVNQVNNALPADAAAVAAAPSMKCPICMNNDLNRCLIPCGHTLCSTCAETLTLRGHAVCYLCRTPVERTVPFFLNGTEIGENRPVVVAAPAVPNRFVQGITFLKNQVSKISCRRCARPAAAAPPQPEPPREFIEDIIGLVNAERQNPVVFAQDTAPSHT